MLRDRADLEAHVAALEKEIATKEEELRQKRLNERKKGKGKAADLVGGDMGEEDWTINERGEASRNGSFHAGQSQSGRVQLTRVGSMRLTGHQRRGIADV